MNFLKHIVFLFLSSLLILHALAIFEGNEVPRLKKRLSNDALIRLIMRLNSALASFKLNHSVTKELYMQTTKQKPTQHAHGEEGRKESGLRPPKRRRRFLELLSVARAMHVTSVEEVATVAATSLQIQTNPWL
ncbi:hypothetical protein ANCCAN_11724 [Ancylostoma caninum]|uniref:Uncharacterized protein n=1 Tax=Ancylostoma caninum TaxID=29170 RepID=A0A368GD65_ANCCA|nr:hypothetical protein ANCCAN_11724 [Ancylostoma caninum]